jgi:trehalose 6-phosphate synthase/phosphatase
MSDSRLVIVSNRLPVAVIAGAHGPVLVDASGGLATGLRAYHDPARDLWVGWPGETSSLNAEQWATTESDLRTRGILPVALPTEQVERYYNGFANRVLWPLFHYLIDRVPVDAAGWEAYREVNEAFADAVVGQYRANDTVWVHDYQLMLLPAMLRKRLPAARIGFFLHIPFPSSEVFRVLPWRSEILTGLLGADLVGFHTFSYMRHFLASLLHVDGVEGDIDSVRVGDRHVSLGVFPMGVDTAHFASLAADAEVAAIAAQTRAEAGGRRILLGIDRLDYTKGIPRRLHAVERLLTRRPELRDTIRYVQVAVPSRGGVESYQRFRRQVEESVGRINGMCGTFGASPIHYLHQSVTTKQLAALYAAADVMLVTPLRDGMNLVAKEFVATRVDEDGVLVLSEFAGAAAELDGAVVVNPYDVEAVAESVLRAIEMTPDERRARMRRLRHRVLEYDIHRWARSFLDRLAGASSAEREQASSPGLSIPALLSDGSAGRRIRLLLDYDGTLVPLARSPELAAPDPDLLTLLEDLTATPGIEVEIVSGRPLDTLDRWFGHLSMALWAEHGFWHRSKPGSVWRAAAPIPSKWITRIEGILHQFAASTPGAEVETKSASVTWHYRRAEREFGARQAHELRMLLGDALSNQPFEVLEGRKVIEVRLRGVSKALVGQRVHDDNVPGTLVAAFGDDRTDADLFRSLPPDSVTVAVGDSPRYARCRVPDYRAVRRILRSLVPTAVSSVAAMLPAVEAWA